MAKFEDAIEWLKEGKIVRRPMWREESYWKLGTDRKIIWSDGTNAHIHINQIEAGDWEIYKEDENLSGKRTLSLGILNDKVYGYTEKDVKEKIQNAQKRLKEELYIASNNPLNNAIQNILSKIFLEEFGDKLI